MMYERTGNDKSLYNVHEKKVENESLIDRQLVVRADVQFLCL